MNLGAQSEGLVIDHRAVALYDKIPQAYIDIVKTMLVDIPGESHASGYRAGMNLLNGIDPRFKVTVFTGTPPAHNAVTPRLRFGGFRRTASGWAGGAGEATFYTNANALQGIKNTIQYTHTLGNPVNVIGFGWCWDMTWHNSPGGTRDSVHGVRWAGSSEGGPQGDLRWGLDADDQALTGNSISMDSYLQAVEEYRTFCTANVYATKAIFTTGPVDGNSGNENGCQREIKHQYIRNFVKADANRILFDYADILVYNEAGQAGVGQWNDGGTLRTYLQIHADNLSNEVSGTHIGSQGCLRLAKAMWVLLARIAGWDGLSGDPTLTVLQPNGGESWTRGEVHAISWSSSGISGNVVIELIIDGQAERIIATVPASQGTYNWPVGAFQGGAVGPGSGYRIRICTSSGTVLAEQHIGSKR